MGAVMIFHFWCHFCALSFYLVKIWLAYGHFTHNFSKSYFKSVNFLIAAGEKDFRLISLSREYLISGVIIFFFDISSICAILAQFEVNQPYGLFVR
jgi:hypothetical protein